VSEAARFFVRLPMTTERGRFAKNAKNRRKTCGLSGKRRKNLQDGTGLAGMEVTGSIRHRRIWIRRKYRKILRKH